MKIDKDTQYLLERISRLSHRMVRINEQYNEKAFHRIKDLTKMEISVLSLLCDDPKIIMRDISERLQVSKSTMTGVIDNLEQLGLVQRVINRQDRRSYALEVTKKGKLAQKEHLEQEKAAYLQLIKAMRVCDVPETYLDQTEKLLDFFEKTKADTEQP